MYIKLPKLHRITKRCERSVKRLKINIFEMTQEQETELVDKISSSGKGIIVFEGPTGSGKTWLLNKVLNKSNTARRFSYESFVEIYINQIKENKSAVYVKKSMLKFLNAHEIVGVEEIDMLWGKEYTQEAIAEIINIVSENTLVILTGIGIEERVPKLLKKLKETNIIYFEKKEE